MWSRTGWGGRRLTHAATTIVPRAEVPERLQLCPHFVKLAMPELTWREQAFRILVGAAAVTVVIAGMRAAAPLLVQVLLATLLAIFGAGPAAVLKRRGVPTGIAGMLVITGFVALGAVVGSLIGTSLADFTRAIPTYESRLNAQLMTAFSWLSERGIDVPEGGITGLFDASAMLSAIGQIMIGLRGLVTNGAVILLLVVFMLLEASTFPRKLRAAWGPDSGALSGFEQFSESVKRYLIIKSIMSTATGISVTVLLLALGVDFPLLWGFLAFFLNFIPNIGSVIAPPRGRTRGLLRPRRMPSICLRTSLRAEVYGTSRSLRMSTRETLQEGTTLPGSSPIKSSMRTTTSCTHTSRSMMRPGSMKS